MNEKITEEQIEKLVHRAHDLTCGMWERLHRLPDFADFRAAFTAELKGDKYGQSIRLKPKGFKRK